MGFRVLDLGFRVLSSGVWGFRGLGFRFPAFLGGGSRLVGSTDIGARELLNGSSDSSGKGSGFRV